MNKLYKLFAIVTVVGFYPVANAACDSTKTTDKFYFAKFTVNFVGARAVAADGGSPGNPCTINENTNTCKGSSSLNIFESLSKKEKVVCCKVKATGNCNESISLAGDGCRFEGITKTGVTVVLPDVNQAREQQAEECIRSGSPYVSKIQRNNL